MSRRASAADAVASPPRDLQSGQRYLGPVLNKVITVEGEDLAVRKTGPAECIRKGYKVAFNQLYSAGEGDECVDSTEAASTAALSAADEQINEPFAPSEPPKSRRTSAAPAALVRPESALDIEDEDDDELADAGPFGRTLPPGGTRTTPSVTPRHGDALALSQTGAFGREAQGKHEGNGARREKGMTSPSAQGSGTAPDDFALGGRADPKKKPAAKPDMRETVESPTQADPALDPRSLMQPTAHARRLSGLIATMAGTGNSRRKSSFFTAGLREFADATGAPFGRPVSAEREGQNSTRWSTMDQETKKDVVDERIIRVLQNLREHHKQREKKMKEKLHQASSMLQQTQSELKKQRRDYEITIQDYEETVGLLKLNSATTSQENHVSDRDRVREADRQRHEEELADAQVQHSLEIQRLQETMKEMQHHIDALEEDNAILHQDIASAHALRDLLEEEVRQAADLKALLEYQENQNAMLTEETDAMRSDLLQLEELKMRAEDELLENQSMNERRQEDLDALAAAAAQEVELTEMKAEREAEREQKLLEQHATIEALQREVAEKSSTVQSLQSSNDLLSGRVSELEAQKRDAESKISKEAHETALRDLGAQKAEIDSQKRMIDTLNEQHAALRELLSHVLGSVDVECRAALGEAFLPAPTPSGTREHCDTAARNVALISARLQQSQEELELERVNNSAERAARKALAVEAMQLENCTAEEREEVRCAILNEASIAIEEHIIADIQMHARKKDVWGRMADWSKDFDDRWRRRRADLVAQRKAYLERVLPIIRRSSGAILDVYRQSKAGKAPPKRPAPATRREADDAAAAPGYNSGGGPALGAEGVGFPSPGFLSYAAYPPTHPHSGGQGVSRDGEAAGVGQQQVGGQQKHHHHHHPQQHAAKQQQHHHHTQQQQQQPARAEPEGAGHRSRVWDPRDPRDVHRHRVAVPLDSAGEPILPPEAVAAMGGGGGVAGVLLGDAAAGAHHPVPVTHAEVHSRKHPAGALRSTTAVDTPGDATDAGGGGASAAGMPSGSWVTCAPHSVATAAAVPSLQQQQQQPGCGPAAPSAFGEGSACRPAPHHMLVEAPSGTTSAGMPTALPPPAGRQLAVPNQLELVVREDHTGLADIVGRYTSKHGGTARRTLSNVHPQARGKPHGPDERALVEGIRLSPDLAAASGAVQGDMPLQIGPAGAAPVRPGTASAWPGKLRIAQPRKRAPSAAPGKVSDCLTAVALESLLPQPPLTLQTRTQLPARGLSSPRADGGGALPLMTQEHDVRAWSETCAQAEQAEGGTGSSLVASYVGLRTRPLVGVHKREVQVGRDV